MARHLLCSLPPATTANPTRQCRRYPPTHQVKMLSKVLLAALLAAPSVLGAALPQVNAVVRPPPSSAWPPSA